MRIGAGKLAATAAAWLLLVAVSCLTRSAPGIEQIAHYDTAGWSHDVEADGGLLYVSDRQGGFLVFDRAAGWTAPRVLAPVKDVISLAPHGGRPLLAARFEGLVLVSSSGQAVARISLGDIANAAVTRGDLGFAAYGANGLVVVRLGDAELRVVSQLRTPGWSHDVKLWGSRALVADWQYGVRVVDVSRPESPVEIGVMPTPATAISVAPGSFGGKPMAAVAEGHAGVSIAAFDDEGRPSLVARHPLGLNPADAPHPETGGWAHGVAWCGNYLFVANWKRGLAILDVQDPRRPRLIAEVPTRGTALGVKAEAQPGGAILVFLADGEAGLRVLRINRDATLFYGEVAAQADVFGRSADQDAEGPRLHHPLHVPVEHLQVFGAQGERDFRPLPGREADSSEPFQLDHRARDRGEDVAKVELHDLIPRTHPGVAHGAAHTHGLRRLYLRRIDLEV